MKKKLFKTPTCSHTLYKGRVYSYVWHVPVERTTYFHRQWVVIYRQSVYERITGMRWDIMWAMNEWLLLLLNLLKEVHFLCCILFKLLLLSLHSFSYAFRVYAILSHSISHPHTLSLRPHSFGCLCYLLISLGTCYKFS